MGGLLSEDGKVYPRLTAVLKYNRMYALTPS